MASIFKRKNRKHGKWIIGYTDENGARRTVAGAKSKAVTEQIAARIEGDVELRKRGILDPRVEKFAAAEQTPLVVKTKDGNGKERITGGHLAEWHVALLHDNVIAKHADTLRSQASKVIDSCGATRISDLTESAVKAVISGLRDNQKLSHQTCNHYLRAIKQFSRWLWKNKRSIENALAHAKGYNIKEDRDTGGGL